MGRPRQASKGKLPPGTALEDGAHRGEKDIQEAVEYEQWVDFIFLIRSLLEPSTPFHIVVRYCEWLKRMEDQLLSTKK